MRFQIIRSLYVENVSRFRHSSSLKWYSVGRIHLASTFFSCLDTRKEGKRKSRPLPRPGKLTGYMMEIENVMRFGIIWSLYLKNVSRFAHSSSLKWYSVGRIHLASTFFSCLDTRKEVKRKSRPLPRSGKMAGYMMEIENVTRFGIIWSLYPEKLTRFVHSPSLGWRPVGRMQYAPTWDLKKSICFPVTR